MDLFSLERLVGKVPIPHPGFADLEKEVLLCVERTSVRFQANRVKTGETDVETYAVPPFDGILAAVREHADSLKGALAGDVVVLVHPFYPLLTDYPRYDDESKACIRTYIDRLASLLEHSALPIVLLESAHHYCAFSSHLLERGLVDCVVLTEFDRGTPLCGDELRSLPGDVFVGGAYVFRCLSHAYDAMHTVGIGHTRVWALPELTVCKSEEEIFTDCGAIPAARGMYVPSERHVKLSALIPSAGS